MVKGIDYTGLVVSFFCHDGAGNYLMHQRGTNCRDEHNSWDFGAGGLKFDEALLDGLRREIEEEYGVEAKEIKFLGIDEIHREHEGKKTHWISFQYLALVDRDKVVNNEPDKHSNLRWVTLDTLPSPLHSTLGVIIEKYKDKL